MSANHGAATVHERLTRAVCHLFSGIFPELTALITNRDHESGSTPVIAENGMHQPGFSLVHGPERVGGSTEVQQQVYRTVDQSTWMQERKSFGFK